MLGAHLVWGAPPFASAESSRTLSTAQGMVRYDEAGAADAEACVVLLHGASGPVSYYRQQATFFAAHGLLVLLPHYFDATRGTSTPKTANYERWAGVVRYFVAECRSRPMTKRVFLLGYSLGASVALAAGSEGVPVDGIAEWYGSLPDDFFRKLKAMPPLLILHGERDANIPVVNGQQLVRLCGMLKVACEAHFYPDQGDGFDEKALADAEARTLKFFGLRT